MHQTHGAGRPAHHVPVGFGQAPLVHLLQQAHQLHRRACHRPLQPRVGAEASTQQFQHLRLLLQRVAVPQPLGQAAYRDVLQFLLLAGGERLLAGGRRQQRLLARPQIAGRHGLGRQVHPAGLAHQLLQGRQLHRHRLEQTALQLTTQFQEGLGIAVEGGGRDRDQQQGRAGATPVALQQAHLAGHGIHQLLRIIGQVEGVLLKGRRQEGDPVFAMAVEAGRGHRFHPHRWMA
jgi:hypothetical protein